MPKRTKNNRKIYKIEKNTKIHKKSPFRDFFDCEEKKLILKGGCG